MGSPDAVDPLVDAVHDPSDRVRLAAIRALAPLEASRSVPHLLAARHDSCDMVVEAATDALIALAPDLLERVLLELFEGASPSDRGNAARGLARLGSEAACSRLIAALREPDRDVRLTAAQALVHAGDPRAEPHLRDRGGDPDWLIRCATERWLGVRQERQSAKPSPPAN